MELLFSQQVAFLYPALGISFYLILFLQSPLKQQ